MRRFVKDRSEELGGAVWYPLLALVAIVIIAGGSFAFNAWVYPQWLAYQRQSVEQSKSFTDANNNMLETYKLEYARLETKKAEAAGDDVKAAYTAQQGAIVTKMCRQISTMSGGTVNPQTRSWLNSKGGC